MSLQRRAYRIARDVVGIVLDWNDRYLSDKDAMKEITRSLLINKENGKDGKKVEREEEKVIPEKNKEKVPELEQKEEVIEDTKKDEEKREEEKKDEIIEVKKDKKSNQGIKFEKKLVPPLIISGFFILIVFGIINPYEIVSNFESDTSTEDKLIQFREVPTDDSVIRTEQFLEIPSEGIQKIQNGSEVILEP
jgi:hypothetical protein